MTYQAAFDVQPQPDRDLLHVCRYDMITSGSPVYKTVPHTEGLLCYHRIHVYTWDSYRLGIRRFDLMAS